MRKKLGQTRYRIVMTAAVVALIGLTAFCWWLVPSLWGAHPVLRMASFALVALLFSLVILLIWLLHSDHGRL
jgi:hypothetical protein